ncbi:15401_t:CDS:2, partial [Funneliformis caledonium]
MSCLFSSDPVGGDYGVGTTAAALLGCGDDSVVLLPLVGDYGCGITADAASAVCNYSTTAAANYNERK